MDIKDTFQMMTGFEPYKYQERLAEAILAGKNVILKAPTGSGKFYGALLPFVHARITGLEFPGKMIYSLPMRTLANSLYFSVKNNSFLQNNEISTAIQTGEYKEDPLFKSDITFTTVDQSLSSGLGIPLSLPPRLSNINAASFMSSYLVFDEFHLFDWERSFSTILTYLKTISPLTRF